MSETLTILADGELEKLQKAAMLTEKIANITDEGLRLKCLELAVMIYAAADNIAATESHVTNTADKYFAYIKGW